jgi:hypothetical protein
MPTTCEHRVGCALLYSRRILGWRLYFGDFNIVRGGFLDIGDLLHGLAGFPFSLCHSVTPPLAFAEPYSVVAFRK